MEFLNQLLAGLIDKFKQKNPKIFGLVISGLIGVYVICEMLIAQAVFDDTSMIPRIIQFVDVVFMAIMGTKTAPFLKEYLDQVSIQEVKKQDNWWTSLIDGFKIKSPVAFGIVAVLLLSVYVGISYSLHFDLIYGEKAEFWLQVLGYIDIAVLVLLGSRTGQYLIDNPPVANGNGATIQSLQEKTMYFD